LIPPKLERINTFLTRRFTSEYLGALNIQEIDKDIISNSDSSERKGTFSNPVSQHSNLAIDKGPLNNNKILRVLCFDDDRIVIFSLVEKLKKRLNILLPNCEFKFDICINFNTFFENISSLLIGESAVYDFVILDQNVSFYYKGTEIAEIVEDIYRAYLGVVFDRKFFNYLFVTEQSDELKYLFEIKYNDYNNRNRLYNTDHIFSKTEPEAIANRIMNIILDNFS
jgi:hypothetical protein